MKKLDLTGQKSGRLTAIAPTARRQQSNVVWECLCECGNTAYVRAALFKFGHIRSCGCLQRDNTSKAKKKHGKTLTTEYKSWRHMKDRCYNKNIERYPNYGGRGIKVCDEWLDSFETFLADMGKKPSPKHSLDRINVDGDYTPENCRWASTKRQSRNRTDNVFITFNDKTQTIAEWAEELGLKKQTLYSRLNGYGWSVEKALTTPIRKSYAPA